MKHSNFYYNDIYLGTLYENGVFEYRITSNQADEMNVTMVANRLESIRQIASKEGFDYEDYVKRYNSFQFKDGFEFR